MNFISQVNVGEIILKGNFYIMYYNLPNKQLNNHVKWSQIPKRRSISQHGARLRKKSAYINFTKYSNYCNSYGYFVGLSVRMVIQVNESDTESDRIQYGTHWNHKNLTKFDRISSDGRTIPVLIGSDIGFINLDQYYGRNTTVNIPFSNRKRHRFDRSGYI